MKYLGSVKVGRLKPNPRQELAIIRLPVKLVDKIGKYAHVFEESSDVIRIVFSDDKELKNSVQQAVQSDYLKELEERIRRLEIDIEKLRSTKTSNSSSINCNTKKTSRRRDLNPRPGDYKSPALPAEPRRPGR